MNNNSSADADISGIMAGLRRIEIQEINMGWRVPMPDGSSRSVTGKQAERPPEWPEPPQ